MTDALPLYLSFVRRSGMVEKAKWYRVIDPLNPLYGCDVEGAESLSAEGWLRVQAMRRVDIFVGDRPFQLVAPEKGCLGVLIDMDHLEASPIQDEVVETGTDRPHGLCLDESEMTRQDGVTLRIARYERATQIALEDSEGELLATATESGEARNAWETAIIDMFERGDDQDDIQFALRNS